MPLELISTELLAYSLRWVHRLGAGSPTIQITLANGRTVNSETTRGVINRILTIPAAHLALATPQDRAYAEQEFTAFFMSWLNAFPGPVLNRPTAQGLSGRWRHISEWSWLAAQAGLPVPRYLQGSYDQLPEVGAPASLFPLKTPLNTVIVVGGVTTGARAPSPILDGCVRLARLTQAEILGIDFAVGPSGTWLFAGATPLPDLLLGGDPLIDTLARILQAQ
jgi:hypothetical protein